MKIFKLNIYNPNFLGQRQDRKAIAQLKNDNEYDLNLPNQRRINNAIDSLSEIPGEDNVNFLLDVADNLKYGTNIDLGKKSYNEWSEKLNKAAKNSLAKSETSVQEKLKAKFEKTFNTKKPLTQTEKDILQTKESLLEKVDFEALDKIHHSNIKNLRRNLDYFIISSEVPTAQKLYILKRLNYFMSPEYKINPQLKDKKTQALAEIVNDIVVDTPESKIPNIKAINQRYHGICAAISICRKSLAYEDKVNYVDMIMSELDDSDYLQVYDITKLGTKNKIQVPKNTVDFDYALDKGYRIVDASAMYWMNIADTAGSANEIIGSYSSFDKTNFDTFEDSHITSDLTDDLVNKQDYYRALLRTKAKLVQCKTRAIKNKIRANKNLSDGDKNLKTITKYYQSMTQILKDISPNSSDKQIREIMSDIIHLQVNDSSKAAKIQDYKKDFVYLPNEEHYAKTEKLLAFLSIALPHDKNTKILKEKVADLLDLSKEINSLNRSSVSSYAGMSISRAQMLYDAAAAYRTQQVFMLDEPQFKQNMMKDLKLPDDETRLLENIDFLIKKLNKNSINPELKKQLAKNFETENDNTALIEALNENKQTIQYVITELMDDLYASCLSVNRKNALVNDLNARKEAIIESLSEKSPEVIETAALLGVKENKEDIVKALDKYIEILKSPECTDEQYTSIFNQMGYTSQLTEFKQTFERLGECLFADQNENIIKGFNAINGLAPDAPIEKTLEVYQSIAQNFNNISHLITGYHNALRVTDSNNNIINTTSAKEIILKNLENIGEILTEKELETLRTRFIKIAKAKSYDENGSILYKDLPSELTKLTPHEKEILDKIDYNINGWYAMTTRRLDNIYQDLKEPLSELNRNIGMKTGERWLNHELQSGLSSAQEVKIIQHMTGRPYYIEYDGRVALDKIKNSPYSGISSTSVTTDAPGWHAQYIADVKPVKIKTKDNQFVTKDVILHDNTWGAAEHDNVWIDENGFKRTDYSSWKGGDLGFITDDKYQNGNIAENLFNKYGSVEGGKFNSKILKRLSDDYDGYKFPLFEDVIMPGKYPNTMQYIKTIREQTLIPPYQYLDDLKQYAQTMTTSELKAKMKIVESVGNSSYNIYTKYLQKIKGSDNILNKGINSRADYDKLPADDKLKIALEKLALIKSYSAIPNMRPFYKELNSKELKLLKKHIQQEARRNFDYAFAKNIDIAKFGTEKSRSQISDILKQFAKDNNITFNKRQMVTIVNSMKNIDSKKFDGSLNNTIDLMSENFAQSIIKNTPDFENKKEKITILANSIKNILQTNMGFTLADLNSSSFATGKTGNIIKWIDDIFDPATDKEFVQIFNNLRNMTTKEFNSKYGDKITDSAMGIKQVTGYELLTQLRAENKKTHNSLLNMIYEQESCKSAEISKTSPSYDYGKFGRNINGYRYVKNKRSFDDIYMDYYFSLLTLTLGRSYDSFKQDAFKKFNVFPAFPVINYESEENYKKEIDSLYNDITSDIEAISAYKAQDKSFQILYEVRKRISKLNPDSNLTKQQYKFITDKLNEFSRINEGDETLNDIFTNIQNLLSSGSMSVAEYKNLTENIYKELSPYEKTIDGQPLNLAVKSCLESINDRKKSFVKNLVDPKYEQKAMELLNKWVSAKAKVTASNSQDKTEEYIKADLFFAQFTQLLEKHRLLKNPQNVLNEYLLMNTKDAKPKDTHLSGDKAVAAMKSFEGDKESYEVNLKNLLFNANMLDIQYTLMKCAQTGTINAVGEEFRKSKLQLKNGTSIPMDSDTALNIILGPMLYDTDLYTARMFIEQLGLSERVVEMCTQDLSFKSAYKTIKRIHSILASVSKQIKIAEEEIKGMGNIDHAPDALEKIHTAQANIARRCKNTNFRLTVDIFNKSIENAITQIKEHPEHSKTAILYSNMNTANSAVTYVAKAKVNQLNSSLERQQIIHDLVNQLNLPENSPMETIREKYIEEFNKVDEFRQSLTQHYDGLNLTA